MTVHAHLSFVKKHLSRRKFARGFAVGVGVAALSAGIIEREKIGHLFQFLETLFLKARFANSSFVHEFLYPPVAVCPAEQTPVQFVPEHAPENGMYEVVETGDSVGAGFFWQKNGQEGSAPVSLFYGGAVDLFLRQLIPLPQNSSGCIVRNVAVKGTVLSDLPRQFEQLEFTKPTVLLISDGGNLLLQWCIQNEDFLRSLLSQFQNIDHAADADLQKLQKDLQALKVAIESVCLMLQGHYEIALGDLLGLKLNKSQVEMVIVLGIAPVWKAETIPLVQGYHPKKVFPMRGNQAAEVFGRYLVTSGNNAIKSALNNAYAFLNDYGIPLRYQDITEIVEVMDGIHPVPSEQRKIAIELLKHSFFGKFSLREIEVPRILD